MHSTQFRRSLSFLLAAILILTLAACAPASSPSDAQTTASTTPPSTSSPQQSSAATGPDATKKEPTVIKYATFDNYYANASYADGVPVVQKMEELMNVKIEWQLTSSSQYATTLETRLAANVDLPDILNATVDITKYGAAGVLADITDYIKPEIIPYSYKWFQEHPEFLASITSADGKVYQLAGYRGRGEVEGDPYGLIIREDWLNKLNLEKPTDIDSLYNVLKAFKTGDPNGNGQADEIPYTGNIPTVLAYSWGLTIHTDGAWGLDNGNIHYTYTTEPYRNYLRFLNRLYTEGLMDPEFATNKTDQINAKISQGLYGLHFSWFNTAISYDKSMQANGIADGKFAPLLPLDQVSGEPGFLNALTILCRPSAFSASSTVLEEALRFFDWSVMSEEANILTNFGVEDVSYYVDANGVYQYTDWTLENPDGLTPMEALRSLGCWPTFAYSFIKDSRYAMNIKNPTVYDVTPTMREYVRDALVFSPASDVQSNEYNMVMNDLNTYADEMRLKFIDGSASLESDWDSYVTAVQGMGVDSALKIMQIRYDTANK